VEKASAVPLDGCPGIVLGEAEIEAALAVCRGGSADSRGKAVYEPRYLAEVERMKNRRFRFVWDPGWHKSMLPEGAGRERRQEPGTAEIAEKGRESAEKYCSSFSAISSRSTVVDGFVFVNPYAG
jgi:hypothetical protein